MTNYNMSLEEKYRLIYVAITRALKDIKIFMPAIKRDNDMQINDILNNIDKELISIF